MKDRTIRMGIAKGADSLGIVLGNILGGKLYKSFSNFYLNYFSSQSIAGRNAKYLLSTMCREKTKLINKFRKWKFKDKSLIKVDTWLTDHFLMKVISFRWEKRMFREKLFPFSISENTNKSFSNLIPLTIINFIFSI